MKKLKEISLAVWNSFSHEFHIAMIFTLVGFALAEIIRFL